MTPKVDAENGWKLENLVYMHLRRGVCKIHYLPLGDNREVDFHVYDALSGETQLMQVCWSMDDAATFEREYKSLLEGRRRTGVMRCTIVTWDTERELPDGVQVVPVWKWCLQGGGAA